MADQSQVLKLHQKYPQWSAAQIALRIGCSANYVRATSQRLGLTLANAQTVKAPRTDKIAQVRR